MTPIEKIQREHGIVGRERELATALAVLGAGRHLLLEGPVGVGKTTVALAVCGHLGRDTVRVDGDDRYSESKLTGWFDPPLVLKQGYGEEAFFAGPLVEAMRDGKVLFINELNRMPESVQNVLLPALDERLLQLPHIGEVRAADGLPGRGDAEPGGVRRHRPPLGGAPRPVRAPRAALPGRGRGGGDRGRRDRLATTPAGAHGRAAHAGDAAPPALPQGRVRARRHRHGGDRRAAVGRRPRRLRGGEPRGAAPRGRGRADHARGPARRHRRRLRDGARRAPGARRRARRGPRRRPRPRGGPQKPDPIGGAPLRHDGRVEVRGLPSCAPEPPAGDAPAGGPRRALPRRAGGARRLDDRREPHAQRLPHRRPRPALLRRAAGGAGRAAARRPPRRPAAGGHPHGARAAARAVGRRARRGGHARQRPRQAVPGGGRLDRPAARRPPAPGGAHGRHVAQHERREHGHRRRGRRGPRAQAAPRGPLRGRLRGQGPAR